MDESFASDGEIRFAPRGAGRFLTAAFLIVWLSLWAVGETVVLWILVRGALALLTGQPPAAGRAPLLPGPALAIGAFLFVWLLFWTLGGFAAIQELLRSCGPRIG